jgi:hypothetical protein
MVRQLALALALFSTCTLVSGCFFISHAITEGGIAGRLNEIDAMPATSDAATISDVLADLARLENEIEETPELFTHQRGPLREHLARTTRAYRLRCARAMPDPRHAMALLTPLVGLAETDPDIGGTIDAALDGIAAWSQARYRQRGTYRLTPDERRENHLRVGTLENTEDRSPWSGEGQCVFSSRPFGRNDASNDEITVRFRGSSRVFVRCYLDVIDFHPNGRFLAEVLSTGGGGAVARVSAGTIADIDRRNHYLDFELFEEGGDVFVPERGLALVRIDLYYVYSPDHRVVFEDGALRLRPEWRRHDLVMAGFAWSGPPTGLADTVALRK